MLKMLNVAIIWQLTCLSIKVPSEVNEEMLKFYDLFEVLIRPENWVFDSCE